MMRYILPSALLSVVSARSAFPIPSSGVSSSSQLGGKILSRARRLGDDDGEQDFSWMSGYTIKFEHCFSLDNCSSDDDGCYKEELVLFSLCPEDSNCVSGCSGGAEYVVETNFFLDAFTEAQLGAREYACEMVRENCEEDDDATCYANAGYDYCEDEDDGAMNLQEYLECVEYGDDGYYVAPYCASDGENIYLGFFTDDGCTTMAGEGTFEALYGDTLEYSTYSIVTDECANCREHGKEEDQNDGDQEDEDDVLEQCEELYTESIGCEENIDVDDPNTDGCSYIEGFKSQYASANSDTTESNKATRSRFFRRPAFIAVFIGLAVLICACCGYGLYKKDSSEPLLGRSGHVVVA